MGDPERERSVLFAISMSMRVVEEYSALLARAFNGAITVDGNRIVAHPSGTLIVRSKAPTKPPPAKPPASSPRVLDEYNDWSDV